MRFFWRIQKRFVISDHMDSSLPKKWKIQTLRIIYHDNGMSSCSLWKKKNNTLILTAKTRKKDGKYGMTVTGFG